MEQCTKVNSVIAALFLFSAAGPVKAEQPQEDHLKEFVLQGFENWAKGTGSVFDLLDENVIWTISGSSPHSKTYTGKKQLEDEVLTPLNQRLSIKIVPSVRAAYADGNTVIVIWDGKAADLNGEPYDVAYAWFMEFDGEKIVKVTAFLDTLDFKAIMEKQF